MLMMSSKLQRLCITMMPKPGTLEAKAGPLPKMYSVQPWYKHSGYAYYKSMLLFSHLH